VEPRTRVSGQAGVGVPARVPGRRRGVLRYENDSGAYDLTGKRDTGNGKRELVFGPILRSKPTCRRSECITSRDVGGDGDGRTPDPIDHREMPMQGWPYREHVGSRGEVLAGSPSVQGLKLSHGVKVSDPG